jgi:hypothetical protein
MGARNLIGNRVVVPAHQTTEAGGVDPSKLIHGSLKVKKYRLWWAGTTSLFLLVLAPTDCYKIPALNEKFLRPNSWK